MMNKILSLGLLLLMGATCNARVTLADREARQQIVQSIRSRVYTQVLDNGMTVICYCTPNTNSAVVAAKVDVGCRHEEAHEWGLAHILEHMWYKGTKHYPEGMIDRLVRLYGMQSGADSNAHTAPDHTFYYFRSDSANWKVFADVIADGLQNLDVRPSALTSELGAISQEVKFATRDQNTLDIVDFVPLNNPYSHNIIGYKEEILAYTADQVMAFYNKHYTPEKITFMVCGNVDPVSVFDYARTTFAGFDRVSSAPTTPLAEPLPFYAGFSATTKTVYHPQQFRRYQYMWLTPAQNTIDHAALSYVAYAIDRRLEQKWVDENGWCMGVEYQKCGFDYLGQYSITITPKEEFYDLDYDAMLAVEINDVIQNGVSDDEFAGMYQYSMRKMANYAENPISLLNKWALTSLRGTDVFTQFCIKEEYLQNVTQDAIKEAAYNYLRPFLMSKEIMLPIPEGERVAWQELQAAVVAHEQALLAKRMRSDEEIVLGEGALPEPTALPERPSLGFASFVLSNGMTVYWRQEPVSPRCAFSLVINNDEAVARSLGVAKKEFAKTVWDTMLLHGTDTYSKKEFDDVCQAAGITITSSGSASSLTVTAFNYNFEKGLELLRLALDKPVLPEEILARKKQEFLEYMAQRKNDVDHQLTQYLIANLYKQWPWKFTEDEEKANLDAITMDDIRDVISLVRDPSRVVGVMTGNFDSTTAQALAEKYLGSLADRSTLTISDVDVAPITNVVAGHVEVANERAKVLALRISCPANASDAPALEILSEYLMEIVYNLRERTGLFYAGWGFVVRGTQAIPGRVCMTAWAVPGSVARLQDELISLLRAVYATNFDDVAVQSLKAECLHKRSKYVFTPLSVIKEASNALIQGTSLDYEREFDERIAAVTTEQLNDVVQRYFDPATWSFITVGSTVVQ
ncbi:MAG: zinc protease [Candidatus Dependentiae bacterium]|nr:zinc protease [Candidatus Dependentiae bacterium]